MVIKRRSSRPVDADIPDDKLVIVAKDKKPLPNAEVVEAIYGETPSPASLRRMGLVALAAGDDIPDAQLSVADRVTLLRTPYDAHSSQEARYRNRVRNRGTAITAMCIVCTGSRKQVTECTETGCPLWAFRFGSDPFFGRR